MTSQKNVCVGGYVVGGIFLRGYTIKSLWFRQLGKISARTRNQTVSPNFHREAHSNRLRLFDVCLKMSSDSKNCVGFVVDEMSEAKRTVSPLSPRQCRARMPGSQTFSQNVH